VGGALPARTWKKPRDHLYRGWDHDAGVADGDGELYGDDGVSEEVSDSEESADYENQDAKKHAKADSNKDVVTNEVDDETNGVVVGATGTTGTLTYTVVCLSNVTSSRFFVNKSELISSVGIQQIRKTLSSLSSRRK